jgi:hypothetical protein
MVLGNYFDNVTIYNLSVDAGREIGRNRTLANLLPILKYSGFDHEECFFTNAFMAW